MQFIAIANIVNKADETIGLRVMDLNSNKSQDITLESAVIALKTNKNCIVNIESDTDIISKDSINKLTKVVNGKVLGESKFVILSKLEGVGYKISDHKGTVITLTDERIILCAEKQGLSNAEIVLENGVKTIRGEFKCITKEEQIKSKQILKVIGYKDKYTGAYINTTSRSGNWSKGLSPFFLSCDIAKNVENGWQYSKVYPEHADEEGNPTEEYFKWAQEGFNKTKADRYPMGKGRRPLYSYWNGEKLSYTEARRKIYIPLYAKAVVKSDAFKYIKSLYDAGDDIVLWDFDGYDHEKLKMTLDEVIDTPRKKMGHAFVIMMLLVGKIEVINDEVIIH